jgi:hypothetical protein
MEYPLSSTTAYLIICHMNISLIKDNVKILHLSVKISYLAGNDRNMKADKLDNRRNLTNNHRDIPLDKQQAGSVKNKFPVYLDGGKTIIFISDKKKEQETIERYKSRGKYVRP